LQGRNVNDSTLELLNVLDQLSELELYFTGVTDAGLEHLQRLQELRLLDLRGTDLTDAGLQKLAGLKQLAHLELSDSKLATAILERDGVSGNDENERLTPGTFPLFTRSRITETGMGKLQRALPNCKSEMGL
jgi:Ran GTPase-activating protein (RanGAP) involved in mRNA processing and transport